MPRYETSAVGPDFVTCLYRFDQIRSDQSTCPGHKNFFDDPLQMGKRYFSGLKPPRILMHYDLQILTEPSHSRYYMTDLPT